MISVVVDVLVASAYCIVKVANVEVVLLQIIISKIQGRRLQVGVVHYEYYSIDVQSVLLIYVHSLSLLVWFLTMYGLIVSFYSISPYPVFWIHNSFEF